jgi:uncharacterized membrane protein
MSSASDRGDVAALVVAAAVFVSLCAALANVWQANPAITDVPVYERYGNAIEQGYVPYRDFRLEYPPGTLPAFAVPALLTSGSRSYARAFALEMVLLGLTAILATFAALRSLGVRGWRVGLGLAPLALAPVLLGSLLLTRFDLYPAALSVAAVALLLAGRDRLGSGVLGAAIAVKLYPAVILPLAVAWTWRRRGRREALVGLGVCVGVAVLVFLPFFVLSPDGVIWSVRRQLDRPLQIESLGSAVLLALHHAAGMPLAWASSHGSQNLIGTVASVTAGVTTVLQLAVLGFIWWRFARSATVTGTRFVEACAAVVVAFVALGKVLSPQFLVWLLPLVGLLLWRRVWPALALLVVACALTRAWFPDRYWRLVFHFDGLASWLVLLRDVALVGILALVVAAIARREPARSP